MPISQKLHDLLVYLRDRDGHKPDFHNDRDADELSVVIDYGLGELDGAYGVRPKLLVSLNGAAAVDFPYAAETPAPFSNWRFFVTAVCRELKTFAYNLQMQYEETEKTFDL